MYLFRALNSYDQLVDPVKNGIASKILIYNATKRFLLSTQGEKISSLSKRLTLIVSFPFPHAFPKI